MKFFFAQFIVGAMFVFAGAAAQWDTDAYRKALETFRDAIRRRAPKQSALLPENPPHLTRMLKAQARLPLDVVAADEQVYREFCFQEVMRLGPPADARRVVRALRFIRIARVIRRAAEKRSA